uniref:Integrase, catalytic region, zinc finger, CCHC-type, peptidase aspartic, catalytic n=1 Tax=Tanacetum cinerariifolium TaxID=118510 RepID=A0A699LC61_TANCI|nr:integrase, catalytic region, zinc finger, CCHC-type, peptidase aspartic, catalytic [Tanacetum cinerariifolium]
MKKPKNVGTHESLATPKPRKPRFLLRWSPTGKMFDQDGKLVAPSNSKSHVDCSNGDNACTSNAMEPKIKRFPNSTSLLGRNDHVAAILGFGDLQTQLFKKVSDQMDNNQDTSKNTKFAKQPNVEILLKIGKTNALSKPVTSNSVSKSPVSKGVNNDKVIAPGMFRISPDKVYKKAKKVPNIVRLDNTKTRRPQPRSNTKNDRVPYASKSSRSKNKEVKVEENHRDLLLSKKKKHISSACNNSKTNSHDVISKVVCAVFKKCLNYVNHDVCLNNCVNGKKSSGRKHKADVSKNETQQKNQPEIKKPKKVGFIKSLATPKPRKPRFLLRWSPTDKMFDSAGKLVAPSNSESHVDCSNGYLDLFMVRRLSCSKHMTGNLKLLINFVWKFLGTVCFKNDHVAAILGFGDLQWENILITRVYFVEGLGHNLFSVGQFCDSDLEVAFRRNACFVRNLEGVNLFKGDRSTVSQGKSLSFM